MLALGSCFAEHIGQRLSDHKFRLQLNPFGILYNPVSILQALQNLHTGQNVKPEELFLHQDLWHHFAFHSRFSHPVRQQAAAQMNASIDEAHNRLKKTNRLLLTWGTAFAYRHREQRKIVANCHKLPGSDFDRFRLQPEQFISAYLEYLSNWKAQQPDLEVLISISPVRHLRDGLTANQRSKAVLLLAAEQLVQSLNFVHYFPAYELVLDDLRDYRFYERDLTHPNASAVDYVWDYFKQACFSPTAKEIYRKIEPVLRAAQHRPYHTEIPAFRKFCRRQLQQIEQLEKTYHFLDFEKEKILFDV